MKQMASVIRSHFPRQLKKRLPRKIRVVSIEPGRSRILNKIYRGRDLPTNVLSFRYDSEYGEIFLCPSVIRKEARASGNSIRAQTAWMIIHAMIHLAGIHHERSRRDEARARALEENILHIFASSKKHRQKQG